MVQWLDAGACSLELGLIVLTDASESADEDDESEVGWSSTGSSGRDIGLGFGFGGAPFRLFLKRLDIFGL